MTMIRSLVPLLFLSSLATAAPRAHSEAWYSELVAVQFKGQKEVRVARGRADVVTATHAIEVEFASKWKESIGQALWYAFQLNKEAGIVLVMEDEARDAPHAIALGSLIEHQKLPIKVWLWPRDFKAAQPPRPPA
jgi:hypothetical protein